MSSQDITLVHLTPSELSSGQISSHNLQSAVQALHRDGIVVLANAVNPEHLDQLNERMVPEAKILYEKATTQRNFGAQTGNIQQEPPLNAPELLFSDVVANKFVASVVECMLGPNPALRFFSANTAFKAEGRQPPHIDVAFEYPDAPFGFAVNVNLVETSPENGATEVWPGTHLIPEINHARFVDNNYHVPSSDKSSQHQHQDGEVNGENGANGNTHKHQKPRVKVDPVITASREAIFDTNFSESVYVVREAALEARRAIRPPIQPSLPKGSVIIRDFRLWHAGLPNKTDDPRVMLVTVLFPSWYRSEARIELPENVKGKIDWGSIVPCVHWLKDGNDYLKGECNAEFDLLA